MICLLLSKTRMVSTRGYTWAGCAASFFKLLEACSWKRAIEYLVSRCPWTTWCCLVIMFSTVNKSLCFDSMSFIGSFRGFCNSWFCLSLAGITTLLPISVLTGRTLVLSLFVYFDYLRRRRFLLYTSFCSCSRAPRGLFTLDRWWWRSSSVPCKTAY